MNIAIFRKTEDEFDAYGKFLYRFVESRDWWKLDKDGNDPRLGDAGNLVRKLLTKERAEQMQVVLESPGEKP